MLYEKDGQDLRHVFVRFTNVPLDGAVLDESAVNTGGWQDAMRTVQL